jgi:hypothetical protein
MRKLKAATVVLAIGLIMVATGCKKKNDPKQWIYNTWTIEQVEIEGDKAGQDAAKATNMIEFTKKGVVKLTEGSEAIEGTYTVNETATSMTTVMGGSTDTFIASGLSETSMTLSKGEEKMVLKAK